MSESKETSVSSTQEVVADASSHRDLIAKTVWYVAGNCLQPEDVEDLVQEMLLRLWQRKPRCAPEATEAYVRRCARNLAGEELRRRFAQKRDERQTMAISAARHLAASGPEPDEQVLAQEGLKSLLAAWGEQLPRATVQVIVLRCLHHLSSREAAVVLKRSPCAVDSALYRARKRLLEGGAR